MGKLADAWVEISSTDAKLDAGLETAKTKLTQFVGNANSLLATIGMGFGVYKVGHFLVDATKKAADLGETMSKVEQTFGESKGIVIDMANDMAKRFGAIKGTTLDAAAALGLITQGAGLSADASAKLSARLTRLADDASSFYNVPLAVALDKIRSGLVGEAEPLRAFGVLLNEEAVKQEAMRMGLIGLHKEMTEGQKVMARSELIFKQLSKAAGDHERTLDSLTNQLRKLNGEWENMKTDVGGTVVPYATDTLVARRMMKNQIEEKGVLGALWTNLKASFGDREARAELSRSLDDPALRQPAEIMKKLTLTRRAANDAFEEENANRAAAERKTLEREAQERLLSSKAMGNVGMMGMGIPIDMMMQIGATTQRTGLTNAIVQTQQAIREKENVWGGPHVMDSESFMKAAQEKILTPQDETLKKQLEELKGMRATLDKIAGMKPMTQQGGMILKGREQ